MWFCLNIKMIDKGWHKGMQMDNYACHFELFGLPYRPGSEPQNADTLCPQKVWEIAEKNDSSALCYGLETFSSGNMTLGKQQTPPFKEHTVQLENCQTASDPLVSSHWNTIWATIGCNKDVITFPMDSQRPLDWPQRLNRWKGLKCMHRQTTQLLLSVC